jgi:hypothetical protein
MNIQKNLVGYTCRHIVRTQMDRKLKWAGYMIRREKQRILGMACKTSTLKTKKETGG